MDGKTDGVASGDQSTARILKAPSPGSSAKNHSALPRKDEGGVLGRREQRIADYLDAALRDPLPEVAVLGGVTADLAKLALRLSQSIDEVLAGCASPREYLDTVPQGVEVMLKVSRQIERCSRLAHELSRPKPAADKAPCGNGTHAMDESEEIAN